MIIPPVAFRDALAQLVGGVVIVTTRDEADRPRGMTATAVCSVSLTPPLVMACMSHRSSTYRAVQESGVFALNILPATAESLARHFATDVDDKFAGIEIVTDATGAPLLADGLAYCDCEVEDAVVAGDHTIFIGRVIAASASADRRLPLLYFQGEYGSIRPVRAEGDPDAAG